MSKLSILASFFLPTTMAGPTIAIPLAMNSSNLQWTPSKNLIEVTFPSASSTNHTLSFYGESYLNEYMNGQINCAWNVQASGVGHSIYHNYVGWSYHSFPLTYNIPMSLIKNAISGAKINISDLQNYQLPIQTSKTISNSMFDLQSTCTSIIYEQESKSKAELYDEISTNRNYFVREASSANEIIDDFLTKSNNNSRYWVFGKKCTSHTETDQTISFTYSFHRLCNLNLYCYNYLIFVLDPYSFNISATMDLDKTITFKIQHNDSYSSPSCYLYNFLYTNFTSDSRDSICGSNYKVFNVAGRIDNKKANYQYYNSNAHPSWSGSINPTQGLMWNSEWFSYHIDHSYKLEKIQYPSWTATLKVSNPLDE